MKELDGRLIAAQLRAQVQLDAERLAASGVAPTAVVVVPTRDEATAWYVRSLTATARKVGVDCRVEELHDTPAEQVCRRLEELSADPSVHGVICQTPLPAGLTIATAGACIAVAKDIDGANPTSLGRLATGLPAFAPATAAAVLEILRRSQVELRGAHAVVVGRSPVVGRPTALLLTAADATVTLCHTRTRDLARVCAQADVLVAAVGRPGIIRSEHVRPGAVVIDVGTNPTPDGGLVGDVAADQLTHTDGYLTPVPGGVGPVTTALLLSHTVRAAQAGRDRSGPRRRA